MNIGLDSNVLVASVKKIGEPYHDSALGLSRKISRGDAHGVVSALVLIEVPGALASSTKMPIEKIYEVMASLQTSFKLRVADFETHAHLARELMFEFRELKSKWEIGSADFHHLASSIGESCEFFVTTDEKHILRAECRRNFEEHMKVVNPDEALETL